MTRTTGSVLSVVMALLLCAGCDSKPGDEYRAAEEIVITPVEEPAPAKTSATATPESKEAVKQSDEPVPAPAKTTPASTESVAAKEAPAVAKMAVPDTAKGMTPTGTAPAESKDPAAPNQMPVPAKDAPANGSPATPANVPLANATPTTATQANAMAPAPTIPTGPLPIKLLIPEKDFTAEGSEKALRVTFDDIDLLKVLNMEPVPEGPEKHFPEWLSNLNGKRIILRGWMYPPASQEGISRFMFVRDNGICCFGRAPKVYDKLGVTLRKGVTTNYIQNRPFDVIGTLLIEPEIDPTDEGQSWLYFLEDAIVIDTGRS